MKSNKYMLSILTIALMGLITGFTQSDELFLNYLEKKLKKYKLLYPAEKVYLHTDKTYYKPGDDIWISGYVLSGNTHKPSDISNILYIELIDPKGAVAKKQMFKALDGQCKAHFVLPHEAPGGLYKLKAYTRWMRNFGNKMVFEKKLQVQQLIKPKILSLLDFEREAYGASDTVLAQLSLRNLSNDPISNESLAFTVHIKGQLYKKGTGQTDQKGEATIAFALPDKLDSSDGILNIQLSHNGRTESISGAIPIVLNKIDLQFMPEGGDAIKNLPCKMAFKALNEFGKPADVEGEVYDSKGNVVSAFSSFHQGMGAFSFVPDSNEVYTAKLLKPSGIDQTYQLPKAKSEGVVLQLQGRNNNAYDFTLNSTLSQKVYVVVHLRGTLLYRKWYQLNKKSLKVSVPIDDKLTGVAQITVFDDFECPLAERLFYIYPENKLQIDVTTNKETYAPREKVTLKIDVKNAEGEAVEGNFSIAVVDDKIITMADDKQDNILSALLLSSDLKGEIHEPSFYFDPKEEKAEEAIDYLMLTQGWRRFIWDDVLHLKKKKTDEAERYDMIIGQITDNAGNGVKSKVVIVDGEHEKFVKLTTGAGGRFSVAKLEDFKMMQIFARPVNRKIKRININVSQAIPNQSAAVFGSRVDFGTVGVKPVIAETRDVNSSIAMEAEGDKTRQKGNNFTASMVMEEDALALEEVVAIGYGSQRKSDLTGSVQQVESHDILASSPEVINALQGQVAGVHVVNSSGVPGANSSIMIRGASSISSNNQPLFIVDGVPVTDISVLSPSDIESISILKNAASTAIYGTRAANGVVIVTTKKGYYGNYHRTRKFARNMKQQYLHNTYKFNAVKEFYSPKYKGKVHQQDSIDKRETIYWNPSVKTDKNGKAKLEFYTSDELTTFRTTVEGLGDKGLVGRSETYFNTEQPISIESKVPPYLVFEDVLYLPVLITNNSNVEVEGALNVSIPQSWQFVTPPPTSITVKANAYTKLSLPVKVGAEIGKAEVNLQYSAGGLLAEDNYKVQVVSKGFPAEMAYSARALESTFSFDLSNSVSQSEQMSITIYNNVLAEMMDGIESVLRQPHGCFEQASAATYPNILILKYLQDNEELSDELKEKATNFIKAGYKKLAGYETKEHGFEWFGKTPPHEGLTAFGLMEFHDMQTVYDGVSQAMLKRTQDWLLSRKDGKGRFNTNKGKYGFSGASDEVTAAYLVYAFSEVGTAPAQYQLEYEHALKEVMKSKDAYRLALMANACLNRNDKDNAKPLIDHIIKKLNSGGVEKLRAEHSIVRSWGKSLKVEVAALWAMALIKNGDEHFAELLTLMDYIFGARNHGGFGSTQATVLALKAITQYAGIVNKIPENGSVDIFINGKKQISKAIDKADKQIKIDHLQKYFTKGVQTFNIRFNGLRNPLSFSANAQWKQLVPAADDACKVRIQTQLLQNDCKQGELVRLSTRVLNKTDRGLPMTVAMVGLPSGLSVQPWQLKKMQEEHEFDYYEIHHNYVVFYFRELAPNARKLINLDLKADVPGEYTSPASCAYLYYTNELKDWHQAGQINIE